MCEVWPGWPCVKCMPGNLGRFQNQLSVDAPPHAAAISSPVQSTSSRVARIPSPQPPTIPLPLPKWDSIFSSCSFTIHHVPKGSRGDLGRACSWRLHYHHHRSLYLRLVAEAFHAPPLHP